MKEKQFNLTKAVVRITLAVIAVTVLALPSNSVHAADMQYSVSVQLDKLYQPTSSTECDSETYMDIWVNGRRQTIWKSITDSDHSTIRGCNRWTNVYRTITVPVTSRDIVNIKIDFFEKDGHYHKVATSYITLYPEQWNRWNSTRTGYSVRDTGPDSHWGDYADQYYVYEYTVTARYLGYY